jgi:non-ribosomal peptide synthetase component F
VVCGTTRLDYAEVDRRATLLARRLVAHGARPETLVALCLPRTADLLPALWAVLKSGAAYLPVDPGYPAERIRLMLGDADPTLILAGRDTAGVLSSDRQVLILEDCLAEETGEPAAATAPVDSAGPPAAVGPAGGLARPRDPEHPAYVIYTSGSTGRPKGVVVTHRSVAHLAAWTT